MTSALTCRALPLSALCLTIAAAVALSACSKEPANAPQGKTPQTARTNAAPDKARSPPPRPTQPARPSSQGSFFDEDKVFKGTRDPSKELAQVPCAGANPDGSDDKPFHPKKVRGTVFAPFGTYATRLPSPSLWEELQGLLIQTAHAHPLPQEKKVKDVEVRLMEVDAAGKVIRGPILTTRTDAEGRYCFRLPDALKLSPALVATTGQDKTLMRRNLVSRSSNDVFLQPEALFQALVQGGVDLTRLPRSEFGNLYAMTDTIVDNRNRPDPLDLTPGTTIAPGVKQVLARLQADERFQSKLKDLQERYGR